MWVVGGGGEEFEKELGSGGEALLEQPHGVGRLRHEGGDAAIGRLVSGG